MPFIWLNWLLAALMGTMINTSNTLEVDLVFPRNETYAPTEWFPIIFAIRKPTLAKYPAPSISYDLWKLDGEKAPYTLPHDLRGADWCSQDPFFAHDWNSCNEEGFEKMRDGARMNYNSSSSTVWFTIKNSSQEVDPVAASTEKTCPGEPGVMLNVAGETMTVPRDASWSHGKFTNGTCAVVASMPSSTPDPRQVEIGRSLYLNMTAALKDRLCRQFDPPADCSKKNTNAAQQLAVAGMSCLLVAFGALRYLLI